MTINSSELISKLSEDLEPMTPAPSLMTRVAGWTIAMVLFSVVAVLTLGARADIHSIMVTPRFMVETIAILIAGLSAGILALVLSSPGVRTKRFAMTASGASLAWILSVGITLIVQTQYSTLAQGLMLAGMMCSQRIILLAVIPAFILAALLRAGAALSGRMAGAMMLVSAGLFGMLNLQFMCDKEHSVHMFVYHLLPVIALGALGWSLGTYLCGFEAKLGRKKKQILEQA